MSTWKCDCVSIGKMKTGQSSYGKLVITVADKEGRCVKCGHYAVADSNYHLFPKGPGIGGYAPIAKKRTLERAGFDRYMQKAIRGEEYLDLEHCSMDWVRRERRKKKETEAENEDLRR